MHLAKRLLLTVFLALPAFGPLAHAQIAPPQARLPSLLGAPMPTDPLAAAYLITVLFKLGDADNARLLQGYVERSFLHRLTQRAIPSARTVAQALQAEASAGPIDSLSTQLLDGALTARIEQSAERVREAIAPYEKPADYESRGNGMWRFLPWGEREPFHFLLVTFTNNTSEALTSFVAYADLQFPQRREQVSFECSLARGTLPQALPAGARISLLCRTWRGSSEDLAAAAAAIAAGKTALALTTNGMGVSHPTVDILISREGQYSRFSSTDLKLIDATFARFTQCVDDRGNVFYQETACGISPLAQARAKSDVTAARALIDSLSSLAASNDRVVPAHSMSDSQKREYTNLIKAYYETFRLMGRANACGVKTDERMDQLLKTIEERHSDSKNAASAPGLAAMAGLVGGLENRPWDDFDADSRRPRTPLPCSLFDARIKRIQLPAVPASLRQ